MRKAIALVLLLVSLMALGTVAQAKGAPGSGAQYEKPMDG